MQLLLIYKLVMYEHNRDIEAYLHRLLQSNHLKQKCILQFRANNIVLNVHLCNKEIGNKYSFDHCEYISVIKILYGIHLEARKNNCNMVLYTSVLRIKRNKRIIAINKFSSVVF